MGEICYLVFKRSGILSFVGVDIKLPDQLVGYPVIRIDDDGVQVKLYDEIEDEVVRRMVRAYIMKAIGEMREFGVPRLEFPCWDLMCIYAVKPESAQEPYWEPDQIIDSFLDLRGPEFMI